MHSKDGQRHDGMNEHFESSKKHQDYINNPLDHSTNNHRMSGVKGGKSVGVGRGRGHKKGIISSISDAVSKVFSSNNNNEAGWDTNQADEQYFVGPEDVEKRKGNLTKM